MGHRSGLGRKVTNLLPKYLNEIMAVNNEIYVFQYIFLNCYDDIILYNCHMLTFDSPVMVNR